MSITINFQIHRSMFLLEDLHIAHIHFVTMSMNEIFYISISQQTIRFTETILYLRSPRFIFFLLTWIQNWKNTVTGHLRINNLNWMQIWNVHSYLQKFKDVIEIHTFTAKKPTYMYCMLRAFKKKNSHIYSLHKFLSMTD